MGLFDFFKKKEENIWDKVYETRKSIWENQFGPFPDEVQNS
ncbi:hypothetical protein [Pseudobacteroides cellulosolvens]|uniref:Uncharacterized protein n=1 Tax=Pseudobacteroides cellulosolvens ATCC 35603 = DSM 2933 TaxID=398512 RepID=A0A0L6JVW0_9FIRM|nr:hypothetical protein [Pseudobacteroides cellulosolvens]KNY29973.1 hypothetical protein Bccel_5250 [Pseudobacteroides cellulosolvens ATCC 35603 = DSM 2933]